MPRHTRNRQIDKLYGCKHAQTINVTIESQRSEPEIWNLDPTFKWMRIHMDNEIHNIVTFDDKDMRHLTLPGYIKGNFIKVK